MTDTTTNPADGDLLPEAEVEDPALAGAELAPEPELDDEGNPIELAEEDDEETEELEHDGKKYALPKSLKPLLLMQGDYTKKTQELADQRRAMDEQRDKLTASLAAASQAEEDIVEAKATVKAVDAQIGELKAAIAAVETELANVDWGALSHMENGEALYRQREQYLRQLRLAHDKLADDRTTKANDLDAKVKARDEARSKAVIDQQQTTAKLFEDRDAALKAKFPKWAEEFPQIQAFVAKTFGIKPEVVAKTADPALLEIARYAKLGYEAEQRDRAARQAANRVRPATTGAAPVRRIAGASPPRTDPSRMSTDAWMEHRRAQLSKKGAR